MDPIEKRELKRRALAKLAAQKRRAGLLRGRVVIASLICFLFLWGIVFAQMATGNDPVLSAKRKTVATRTATRAKREVETTDSQEVNPRRGRKEEAARSEDEEAVELEPEFEEAATAEGEVLGPEFEPVESEAVEAEPEFVEEEVEPLVTSQS
jgi:hypothetical protein